MTTYSLWENDIPYYDDTLGQKPRLTAYPKDGAKACVLICPGGGYEHLCMDKEGEWIANMYNENGIAAFVLEYRLRPYHYPAQLEDVLRAVRYVRSLASIYGYDPDKIAICGFSAGGHLASMAVTHFDEGKDDGDAIDALSSRPDLGILCYPVITMGDYTHEGSKNSLLADQRHNAEMVEFLSSELAVKDTSPPCFIVHTAEDNCVPVQNSMKMASALIAKKIPVELHIFPYGYHGFGYGVDDYTRHAGQWAPLSVRYIKDYLE